MDEDRKKSEEERFEESLRQILDSTPSGTAGRPPRPRPRADGGAPDAADAAEKESKALFWFKLARMLAIPTLLVLLVKFVLRITAAR